MSKLRFLIRKALVRIALTIMGLSTLTVTVILYWLYWSYVLSPEANEMRVVMGAIIGIFPGLPIVGVLLVGGSLWLAKALLPQRWFERN